MFIYNKGRRTKHIDTDAEVRSGGGESFWKSSSDSKFPWSKEKMAHQLRMRIGEKKS